MSSDNPEEPLRPASEIFRPSVPPPTASSTAVRAFLVQFFCALNCDRTLPEAKAMAQKLNVDEIALYELPEKKFLDEFEYEGKTIYDALQRSKYGYCRIAVIGPSLKWLEQHLFSPAPSKDSSSSGGKKFLEPSSSPSSLRFSPSYSLSSIFPAEAKLPTTRNGSQRDLRSDEGGLKEDDVVDSIRFRRLFSHDID